MSLIILLIGPSTAYAWMVTAQVIPVGVFGPLVGRMGDIYDRRYFIMAGNMFGLIGCVMGATAQSVNVAIGGGIFIGVASACQQLAWSGLGEMVPRKYRSVALGIFELCCAPPGAFGPIIGQ
jgi:MFS family permease